jgi:ACR3 family arsenite transporter
MGIFERWLTLWVGLGIIAGVVLGLSFPATFVWVSQQSVAQVNVIVAILVWAMIYPMMIQIDWASIRQASREPKGLMLTIVVNWAIKPFTMAAIAVLFFKFFWADLVPANTAEEVIAGMILLGVAPCTAMVFVWSQLVRGHAAYTLVQVSINDVILIFAFAPLAGILLGVTDITVPWETLVLSTLLYVVAPLLAGVLTRIILLKRGQESLGRFISKMKPLSISGLILTVVILFGLQSETIIQQPLLIALIAVPLILQTYGIFFLSWWGARLLRLPHPIAGPACLIGTSNFFELAVAVAIGLFGMQSAASLATVVGVLVEVPLMLSLVYWLNSVDERTSEKPSQPPVG